MTVIPLLACARIGNLISLKRVLLSDCFPTDFVRLLRRIHCTTKAQHRLLQALGKVLHLAEGK